MAVLMTDWAHGRFFLFTAFCIALLPSLGRGETLIANPNVQDGPDFYLTLLDQLEPGDTLFLPAGTYRSRLKLNDLQGVPTAWITISGPDTGPPAVVTTDSTCCNNIQLGNTAYVEIKNLTIDANSEQVNTSVDAINAKGGMTHHILIENCLIRGVSYHQQTVGISTKSTAWNWTIRNNTIVGAGTGIYFGSSDGSAPFVAGVIEGNLFVDTIGYNMQIKHQNDYSAPPGMPSGQRRTIIRNNVFTKRLPQSSWPSSKFDGPRPNLLVDGFPSSGAGSNDMYDIYGNFFYMNQDNESLLQASGRATVHDNVFVGNAWTGVLLTDHNLPLRLATVYNNTIYSVERGI